MARITTLIQEWRMLERLAAEALVRFELAMSMHGSKQGPLPSAELASMAMEMRVVADEKMRQIVTAIDLV